MKTLLIFFGILLCPFFAAAQKGSYTLDKPDPNKNIMIVEASCGQCKFGMPGKGCKLAVRIDGHPYFVSGTDIDSHGDAHAHQGFCEAIRTAEVQGSLVKDKFEVTYFKLIENSIKVKPKK